MTYTEQDKKLIEEFQNFADSIVWSNDDGSEKYIGVGNMADWWLDKIHQALAEEREKFKFLDVCHDYKTKEQFEMFISARKQDIDSIKLAIKDAEAKIKTITR